ncbi:MAG: Glycogen synthase [Syntrophus sp. PtaB.Bin001]|nr:MAG: Glycogen synthase [Syntrophus sp. PtaB.Bin001]
MFGWEYPPYMSGGLGTACLGLTRALAGFGHHVFFVVPHCDPAVGSSPVSLISASGYPLSESDLEYTDRQNVKYRIVDSPLSPYLTESEYSVLLREEKRRLKLKRPPGHLSVELSGGYGRDLMEEVLRYGQVAGAVARDHSFDIIHAHDWMAVYAGIHARTISGKPLVLHIHALEFDRSGDRINQEIYNIERHGMHSADHIVTVSEYTKKIIVNRYGVDSRKVSVVYNAAALHPLRERYRIAGQKRTKTVLFLGRITFQKGPEYFIEAAARVLKVLPDVMFVMAGTGDMMDLMSERIAELGIGRHFHFTGFLQGAEVERIFALSDLYVMPSVSEPFGISPLEALLSGVPVMISKQSGVSEILNHVLKVNFWDIDEMADQMVAVLKYPALVEEMMKQAAEEISRIRWENSAARLIWIYRQVLAAKGA